MPRVETRGSENEEEIAGYRNHFNSPSAVNFEIISAPGSGKMSIYVI